MLPYTPLHHLLLADAGAAAGDDQRQRLRRADRLPRRGRARAPGADRRRLPHPRPPDPHPHRRLGRARRATPGRPAAARCCAARAATCPTRLALPVAAPRAAARLRRRAEEHLLPRQGRAGLGRPPHRRPRELRDPALLPRGGRALRSASSRSRRELVAHDLHPDYLSTKYALEREGVELVGVQHHHAHLAACLAEHGETRPGARRDLRRHRATGRTARSGAASCSSATSAASSAPATCARCALPGGDAAIREPWRMACAWLRAALGGEPALPPALARGVEPREWRNCLRVAAGGARLAADQQRGPALRRGRRRSAGRRARVSYEGQAAIELEAMADPAERGRYELPLARRPCSTRRRRCARRSPTSARRGARRASPPASTTASPPRPPAPARELRRRSAAPSSSSSPAASSRTACCSSAPRRSLEAAGLRVLVPERLPPNDGGISFGQAAVAAACCA